MITRIFFVILKMFIVLATFILLSPLHEVSAGATGYFIEHSDHEDLNYTEVKHNAFFGKPEIIKVFKQTEWTISDCTYDTEIIPAPDLRSYYKCGDSSGELIPQKFSCRKGQIFNAKLEKCTKLPGKGYLKCIIRNRKCPKGLRGIVPHPNPRKKDLYLQCTENDIHVLKCIHHNHIFDIKRKTCIRTKLRTIVVLDESKGRVKPFTCTKPEIIFKHPYLKQNCFYNCMLGHLKYELVIQCPKKKHRKQNKSTEIDESEGNCKPDASNQESSLERAFPDEPPKDVYDNEYLNENTEISPVTEKNKSKYGHHYYDDNDNDETPITYPDSNIKYKKNYFTTRSSNDDEDPHLPIDIDILDIKKYLSHFTTRTIHHRTHYNDLTSPLPTTGTPITVSVPDTKNPITEATSTNTSTEATNTNTTTEATDTNKTKAYGFAEEDLWPPKYPINVYKRNRHKTTTVEDDSTESETHSATTINWHFKTKKYSNATDDIFKQPIENPWQHVPKWRHNRFEHTINTIPTDEGDDGEIDYTRPTKPMKKSQTSKTHTNIFDDIFKYIRKWNNKFEHTLQTIPTYEGDDGEIDYTRPTKPMKKSHTTKKNPNIFEEIFAHLRKWNIRIEHIIPTIPTNEDDDGEIDYTHPTKPMKKSHTTKKNTNMFEVIFKHRRKWNNTFEQTMPTIPTYEDDDGEIDYTHPTKPMKKSHTTKKLPNIFDEIFKHPRKENNTFEQTIPTIPTYEDDDGEIDYTHPTKPMKKSHTTKKNTNLFEVIFKHRRKWNNTFEQTIPTIPTYEDDDGEIDYTHPTKPMKKSNTTKKNTNLFEVIFKHRRKWNNTFEQPIPTIPTYEDDDGKIDYTHPTKPMKKSNTTKKNTNLFEVIFKHRRKWNNTFEQTIPTIPTYEDDDGEIDYTHPTKPMKKSNTTKKNTNLFEVIFKHRRKWNNTFAQTIPTIPTYEDDDGEIDYTHPTKPMKKSNTTKKNTNLFEVIFKHRRKWNNTFEQTIPTIPTYEDDEGEIDYTHPTKPMKKSNTTKKNTNLFEVIFKHRRKWNNTFEQTIPTIPTYEDDDGEIDYTHPTKPMKKSNTTKKNTNLFEVIFKHRRKWNNTFEQTIPTIPTYEDDDGEIDYTHPTKPMKKSNTTKKNTNLFEVIFKHRRKWNNTFEQTIPTIPTYEDDDGEIDYTHPTKPMKKSNTTKKNTNLFEVIFKHRRKWNNTFEQTIPTIPTYEDDDGEIDYTHPTKPMKKSHTTKKNTNLFEVIFKHRRKWNNKFEQTIPTIPTYEDDDGEIDYTHPTKPMKKSNTTKKNTNMFEVIFKHRRKWNNTFEQTMPTIPTYEDDDGEIDYTHPTKPMKKSPTTKKHSNFFDEIFAHLRKWNNRFKHTIPTIPTYEEDDGEIDYTHPTKPMKKSHTIKKHPNIFEEIFGHLRKWNSRFEHTLQTIPTYEDNDGEIDYTHPTKPMKKSSTTKKLTNIFDVIFENLRKWNNRFEHTIPTIPTYEDDDGAIDYTHPTKPMKKLSATKKHTNLFDDIFGHPRKLNNRFEHTMPTIPTYEEDDGEIHYTHPTKPMKKSHITKKYPNIFDEIFAHLRKWNNRFEHTLQTIPTYEDDDGENDYTHPTKPMKKSHTTKKYPNIFDEIFAHLRKWNKRFEHTLQTIPTNEDDDGEIDYTHPTKPMKKSQTTKKDTHIFDAIFKHPRKLNNRSDRTIKTIPTTEESGEIYFSHPTKPMKKRIKLIESDVSINLSDEMRSHNINKYHFPNQEDSKVAESSKNDSIEIYPDFKQSSKKRIKFIEQVVQSDNINEYNLPNRKEDSEEIYTKKKLPHVSKDVDEQVTDYIYEEPKPFHQYISHTNHYNQPKNINDSGDAGSPEVYPNERPDLKAFIHHTNHYVLPGESPRKSKRPKLFDQPKHIKNSDDAKSPEVYPNEHPGLAHAFIHHTNHYVHPGESPQKSKLPKLFDQPKDIKNSDDAKSPEVYPNKHPGLAHAFIHHTNHYVHPGESPQKSKRPKLFDQPKDIKNSDDAKSPEVYPNKHPGLAHAFIHHTNHYVHPGESPQKSKRPKLFDQPKDIKNSDDAKSPEVYPNKHPGLAHAFIHHTNHYVHPGESPQKSKRPKLFDQPKDIKNSDDTKSPEVYPNKHPGLAHAFIHHTNHYVHPGESPQKSKRPKLFDQPKDIKNSDDAESPEVYPNKHPGLNAFIHHTNHYVHPGDITESPQKSKRPKLFDHQPKVPIDVSWETLEPTKKKNPGISFLPWDVKEHEDSGEKDTYSTHPWVTKKSTKSILEEILPWNLKKQPNKIKGYNFPDQEDESTENYSKKGHPHVNKDLAREPIKNLKPSKDSSEEPELISHTNYYDEARDNKNHNVKPSKKLKDGLKLPDIFPNNEHSRQKHLIDNAPEIFDFAPHEVKKGTIDFHNIFSNDKITKKSNERKNRKDSSWEPPNVFRNPGFESDSNPSASDYKPWYKKVPRNNGQKIPGFEEDDSNPSASDHKPWYQEVPRNNGQKIPGSGEDDSNPSASDHKPWYLKAPRNNGRKIPGSQHNTTNKKHSTVATPQLPGYVIIEDSGNRYELPNLHRNNKKNHNYDEDYSGEEVTWKTKKHPNFPNYPPQYELTTIRKTEGYGFEDGEGGSVETESNTDEGLYHDAAYDDTETTEIIEPIKKRKPTTTKPVKKKKMCTTKKPSKEPDFDSSNWKNSDEITKHHRHDSSKTEHYKKHKYDGMCKEEGTFRFKNSCTKYYKCLKSRVHFTMSKIYKCPSCMKFNAALGKCDLPGNVPECLPNNHHTNRHCTGHGLFPIPKDPHQFYKCKTNKEGEIKLKVLTCGHNKQFNPHTTKCDRTYHSKGYKPLCKIENEYIVDKYNCARAYFCNKHKKINSTVSCPSGHIFNTLLTHNRKIHCAQIKESKLYNWGKSIIS